MKQQPPAPVLRKKWLSFAAEVWNDHDFWIKVLAVKGGAGAVVVLGVMAIAQLVALPFLVAALGIAFCGGLVAMGLYGVFLGGLTMWDRLVEIYHKVFLGKPPRKRSTRRRPLLSRFADSPRRRAFLSMPLVKKFLKSHAWRATQRITRKQEDLFLAGLAMKGSIISTIIGISLIVTQILVLPVIAVGSLLSFTTIFAVSTIASGVYGIYLSIHGLIRAIRAKSQD